MIFSLVFLLAPVIIAIIPFIRSFDPMSRLFSHFVTGPPKMILASISNFLMSAFGAIFLSSVFLKIGIGNLGLQRMLDMNLQMCSPDVNTKSQEPGLLRRVHDSVVPYLFRKKSIKRNSKVAPTPISKIQIQQISSQTKNKNSMNKQFRDSFLFHNYISILLEISKSHLQLFTPSLQGIGLVFCIGCNFFIINFYKSVEAYLIFFMGLGTVGSTIMNIFFLRNAARVHSTSEGVILFWRGVPGLGPLETKQVRAMQPIATKMGQFFKIRDRTVLDVIETILDYTVSLVLTY